MSQIKQDTSPMRVTLDIQDANRNNNGSGQKVNQIYNSKMPSLSSARGERKLNKYINDDKTNQNSRQSNLNTITNKSQYISQPNSQPQSIRPSQIGQNVKVSNKYEQMAQVYSLEALIKQAQQKKTSTSSMDVPAQVQVQYTAINNKIDNFEGDNDNVDEEYESSPEKSNDVQNEGEEPQDGEEEQKPMIIKSPPESKQKGTGQQVRDESDYALSSDSKYNRLSNTPSYALISSDRPHNLGLNMNEQNLNRIFSDLSSKVVNINTAGTLNQNPFNQLNTLQQNHQILNKPFPDSAYASSQHQEIQNNNQKSYPQNSELCNYESQAVGRLSYQSQVTPFHLLKNDYMEKKNQVINKLGQLESNQEEEQYESNQEYEQEQEEEDEQQHEEEQQQYDEVEQEQEEQEDAEDFQSYQQEQNNDYQSKEQSFQQQYNEQNSKNTLSPVKITESTEQFFNKVQPQQLQPFQLANQITVDQTVPDKFLSFDDFLNRNSIRNSQNPNQKVDFNPIIQKQNQQQEQTLNLQQKGNQLQSQKSPTNMNQIASKELIQQKGKDQELKKKRELEMLKQKAIEKEQMRIKRIQSAIKIQKWVRGFLERKKFQKKKVANFRFMRKFRRLMSVAYGKYKLKFIQQLVYMIQQAHQQQKLMEDEIYQKYLEHCVLMIQKTWKGYNSRTRIQGQLIQRYKTRRLLNAIVQGWKIRRILTGCREIIQIKRDLLEIEQMFGQTKGPRDPKNKQIMMQRKKKIEELCRVVPQLYKKGRWIFSLQKKLNSQKKQSMIGLSQIKSSVFNQAQATPKISVGGEFSQTAIGLNRRVNNEINFEEYHQQNKSPILSSRQQTYRTGQGQEQIQNSDYKNRLEQQNQASGMIWPSQANKQQQQWPPVQESANDDQSIVLWPSQRQQNAFQSTTKFYNNDFQIMSERSEPSLYNHENLDIPLTQRSAIADKLQNLDQQQMLVQKPNAKKRQQQQHHHFQSETSFESRQQQYQQPSQKQSPRKSPVKKHFLEDEDEVSQTQYNTWSRQQHDEDDRPIQGMKNSNMSLNQYENEDDRPIQPRRQQSYNQEDERPIKPSANQAFNNFDDIPIKPLKKLPQFDNEIFSNEEEPNFAPQRQSIKQDNQFNSAKNFASRKQEEDLNSSQVIAPKYNFEEMLEKALQDQGAQPSQNQNIGKQSWKRRSKTARGQESENQEEEDNDDDNGQPKTKKEAKKQNLKKRQKYDPRKAIEEAKKQQQEGENPPQKQPKSAFPEGVLNNKKDNQNDRIRSQTSQPKGFKEEEQESTTNNNKSAVRRKKFEKQQREQENNDQEDQQQQQDAQSTTNATNSTATGAKPFLKRKTQAVKFQKVDWKVKSRIDCWTNKGGESQSRQGAATGGNQSQTRRKNTSALRSPKAEIPNNKQKPQQQQEEVKAAKKQITPAKQQQQQKQQIPKQQVEQQQVQQEPKSQQQSQKNVAQFAQPPIQSINIPLQQKQIPNKIISIHPQQLIGQRVHDETLEVESIPDENDQYEPQNYYDMSLQKQNTQISSQWESNVPFSNQLMTQSQQSSSKINQLNQNTLQQQNIYSQHPSQYQLTLSNQDRPDNFSGLVDQFNINIHQQNLMSTLSHNQFADTQDTNLGGMQQNQEMANVTLQLEELEKVYEMFHPKEQSFADSEIQERINIDTIVPHMTLNSMFFNCYSDDIYDTILEDLREHYLGLCNE